MVRVSILMVLPWLVIFSCCSASKQNDRDDYVHDACNVTHYTDLCIGTLSSFSKTAKNNPIVWARAGVSVTIGEAKKVAQNLATLKKDKKSNLNRGRNKVALSDCVECFQDALDNLHKSLDVLRKLSTMEFGSQVDDVATWVSAALTDEDTCVEGFDDGKEKRVKLLINRVSNVTYMTSNALALINKLAMAGPECLMND